LRFIHPVHFPIFEHELHVVFHRVFDTGHGGWAVEILTEVAVIDRRKPRRRLLRSFLSD
jgi:hypothetical protein